MANILTGKGHWLKTKRLRNCENVQPQERLQTTLGALSRSAAEWILDPLQFATHLNQPLFSLSLSIVSDAWERHKPAQITSSNSWQKHFLKGINQSDMGDQGDISRLAHQRSSKPDVQANVAGKYLYYYMSVWWGHGCHRACVGGLRTGLWSPFSPAAFAGVSG